MEKNKIIILEGRGFISVNGQDARGFLQNILSNDVDKVNLNNSVFSAILTPQGKYLYEFFVIKSKNGYLLDCDGGLINEIIETLSKYKLRSKIEIKDTSKDYVVGLLNFENFQEIKNKDKLKTQTIIYRDSPIFVDPRSNLLGARIISKLEKLYLTIKKLNLKIVEEKDYLDISHKAGFPTKGLENLKEKLFGLEANLDKNHAIDFKKGCYVGQENTARMSLKNKIRKRLLPVYSAEDINLLSDIYYQKKLIGKILIPKPYPFALFKLNDPDLKEFHDKELICENSSIKIINTLKEV